MTRALALTGLDTRRIQKDRRRFTLNEAAHEFFEMGYDLVPARDERHARYVDLVRHERDHGRSVGAVLKTRCGCEKRMFVPYPPPQTVRIPIAARPVARHATETVDLSIPMFGVREFKLDRIIRTSSTIMEVVYVEADA